MRKLEPIAKNIPDIRKTASLHNGTFGSKQMVTDDFLRGFNEDQEDEPNWSMQENPSSKAVTHRADPDKFEMVTDDFGENSPNSEDAIDATARQLERELAEKKLAQVSTETEEPEASAVSPTPAVSENPKGLPSKTTPAWQQVQQQLNNRGIAPETMDFGEWNPAPALRDHLQRVPAKQEIEAVAQDFADVRKIAALLKGTGNSGEGVTDDFLHAFNEDYEDTQAGRNALLEEYYKTAMLPDSPAANFLYHFGNRKTRPGGVMVGSGMDYAGQLLSTAGTIAEGIAEYFPAYGAYQNEIIGFNPSAHVPERDTTLIKKYVSDPLREKGAELSRDGQALVEKQKEGLGKFGKFAVDLGSAATQMMLDIGLGSVTGGGMAISSAMRSFGGTAAKASAEGADLNQQLLYASTSAAATYGIEQLCNVAYKGLKSVVPGVADKVITEAVEKLAQKLAKNPEGATALKNIGMLIASGISEGTEEVLESILQPFLEKATYNKDAETVLENKELWGDAAYDGLIGLILGVFSNGASQTFGLTNSSDSGHNVDTQTDPHMSDLAAQGEARLRAGEMPTPKQLEAMNLSEAEARGKMVMLNLDQIDAADTIQTGESFRKNSDTVITDGSHLEDGQLKPNVTYKTGEHDYIYQTNEVGLISRVIVDGLQFKTHDGRLKHNPNTYGKQAGDHAGHLIGDRFGGSPELDNLVSQAKNVNMREYKEIENQWANALKNGKKVSVKIDIKYNAGKSRPSSFVVSYDVNGTHYFKKIKN